MHIQFVKKILADGTPCRKCADIEARLTQDNYWDLINETLIADEQDIQSPGMRLAAELEVDYAPFFVVTDASGNRTVYTIYLRFVKEVLGQQINQQAADRELLESSPGLDLL